MTIGPTATLGVPVPAVGAPCPLSPGDFLTAFINAMADEQPVPTGTVEPVETPLQPIEPGQVVELVETSATEAPTLPTEPRLNKLDDPLALVEPERVDERVETPGTGTPTTVVDPLIVALVAQHTAPTPARLDKLDVPKTTLDVSKPENHPKLAVAGMEPPTKDPAPSPVEAPPSSRAVPVTAVHPAVPTQAGLPDASQPAAVVVPTSSVAPTAPTGSVASAPSAPPTTLDRVQAQVFPEVTGLVSRGSGTHRITLTLNPEQLGEVRVVMTMRHGAVHVRLAAGQEARGALADGAGELGRLLEHAGATDARVVVRELAAATVAGAASAQPGNQPGNQPGTQNPSSNPQASTSDPGATTSQPGAGGERSPDQHARTRADHTARDGFEPTSTGGHRASGSAGPIEPVTGTRVAGVDLTM